jgi:hypothetical protein
MKGLELPINMIIVIAIAVLVLVVVVALFTQQTTGGFRTIDINNAFAAGCASLRTVENCNPSAVNTIDTSLKDPSTNVEKKLIAVCSLKDKNLADQNKCAQACGCVI